MKSATETPDYVSYLAYNTKTWNALRTAGVTSLSSAMIATSLLYLFHLENNHK